MHPFGRWSYAPARREPGSRQPEQYALDAGLIQISGHGQPSATLLQSKVAPRGGSDHHLSALRYEVLTGVKYSRHAVIF